MGFKWKGGKPPEQAYTPSYRWGLCNRWWEKDIGLCKLGAEGSERAWYPKNMGCSALTNEEITTHTPKASQEIVGTGDMSWILHILKSAPFPWGSLWRSPSFVSGMGAPVCFPEGSPAEPCQGLVVGFLCSVNGVLCAEGDKGVPCAVSYVCSPGRCDHSSQLDLESVGSCFLLMQSNKNIIITKVRLNDSLK